MIPIPSILDRLMETGTPFRMCGGAAALADVKDRPTAIPAVFAFTSSELSSASERTGRIIQRTAATIGIVLVTQNLSQGNNAAAINDVEELRKYCRRKLVGFLPDGMADPLEHVAGELQQVIGGTVWFEDAYSTAYYTEEE